MVLLNRFGLSFAAIGISLLLVGVLKSRANSDASARLTAKPISSEQEGSIVGGAGIYRNCIEYTGVPSCESGGGVNGVDPTGKSCSTDTGCPAYCPGAPKGKVVGPPPATVVKWYGRMCGWVSGTGSDKCVDTIPNILCTKHTFVCNQETQRCAYASSADDGNFCGTTWVCF